MRTILDNVGIALKNLSDYEGAWRGFIIDKLSGITRRNTIKIIDVSAKFELKKGFYISYDMKISYLLISYHSLFYFLN